MPRKKTSVGILERSRKSEGILSQIKLGESYTSLILGIIVVIVASILLMVFVKNRNKGGIAEISSQKTENLSESKAVGSTYTVVQGDTLWSISEKIYKSGYNWVDIAKANNLSNPDLLDAGTKLAIPKVESKVIATTVLASETSPNAITGSTYSIKKGDDLWDIAVRAYGDGYRWVDIAKANNLSNPDIIHSDNTLTIPR